MKLAENIRKYRTERGLTQEELAVRLSISAQAISKWERGESQPDAALLTALADVLGVSLDRLFGRQSPSLEDLLEAIPAYIAALPQGEKLHAVRLLAMAADVDGVTERLAANGQKGYTSGGGYVSLRNSRDEGFTIGSLRAELPFFAIFCQPEGSWAGALTPNDAYMEWFALLSDPDVVKTLFGLFALPGGFSFDDSWAAGQFGLADPAGVLAKTEKLRVLYHEEILIDRQPVRIWFYRENPALIALFSLMNEAIFHQRYFAWQADRRTKPFFEQNEEEFCGH